MDLDGNTTPPPLPSVIMNEAVHVFHSQHGWFIATKQTLTMEEIRGPSEFPCKKEDFLDAAAVCQQVAPEAALAYTSVINAQGLNAQFSSQCEARDVVISDHLAWRKQEWLGFGRKLDHANGEQLTKDWIDYLDAMKDRMRYIIQEHPNRWRQVLPTSILAIADCVGRIRSISHPFPGIGELESPNGQFSVAQLTCVRDRYTQELEELDKAIADLSDRWTTVPGPTLSKFLLHIVVLLMASEYEVIRAMPNYQSAISWTEAEWQRQIQRSRDLSDDDYLALADVLAEYRLFPDDTGLAAGKLKEQHEALMAGLAAMALEFTWGSVRPLGVRYTASMNIMILCACLGILPACPDDKIHSRVDIDYLASQLSRSPLHNRINCFEVIGEHNRLIHFLTPQGSLMVERNLAAPGNSRGTAATQLTKRPSHGDIRDDGKQPKFDGAESD
ncbi:hypothetical protein LOZ66_006901 [Ophidiomyces ophidiicola]|nr:hypothetical protein LOZ66_006901 [Ophidiomyces ophidiicola]